MKAPILLPIVASMAIAGFTSQVLPLTAFPKALLVGLVAMCVFVVVFTATSMKRSA
jgi:hypothetical protein